MKPGVVGTVLVLLAGGAAGGAVFLKDQAKLKRATEARDKGLTLLEQGNLAGAREELSKAAVAATRVSGLSGLRSEAHDVADAVREASHTIEAFQKHPERPLQALRVLGGRSGKVPPGTEKVLKTVRASLLVDAALRLEQRERIDQAAAAFTAALEAAQACDSPRREEADKGRRRMVLVGRLRDAEQALRAKSVDLAGRQAEAAKLALDKPGSPFQDPERIAALKKRLDVILAQVQSGKLVATYRRRVAQLADKVAGPELGTLLGRVKTVQAPTLAGGHPLAEAHQAEVTQLTERLGRIAKVAREFAGMVLARKTSRGGIYIDRTEVTNADFERFVRAGAYAKRDRRLWSSKALVRLQRGEFRDRSRKPGPRQWSTPSGKRYSRPPQGRRRHPVRGISAYEAQAYARWAGKRLPTTAEWSAAAGAGRGSDYPWGNRWRKRHANLLGSTNSGTPQRVGSYPSGRGPSGALDMVGNVAEIVTRGNKYYLAGGSYNTRPEDAKLGERKPRLPPYLRSKEVGFRCAKELKWDG